MAAEPEIYNLKVGRPLLFLPYPGCKKCNLSSINKSTCFDMIIQQFKKIDTKNLQLTNKSFITEEYSDKHSDLIFKTQIDGSNVLERLGLKNGEYFVVSAHREENINSDNFMNLVISLNAVAERYQLPVIVSTHPRTRNRIEETGVEFNSLIQLMKPLGFHDYNHLQKNAKAVLSDSGTISEESSIMNFPALNIREAHERPEAKEESSVIMTGLNLQRIIQGLSLLEIQGRGEDRALKAVAD